AWQQHGAEVITHLLEHDPGLFFKVIATLMPRNVRVIDGRDTPASPEQRANALLGAFRTLVEGGYQLGIRGSAGGIGAGHPAGGGIGAPGPLIDLSPVSKADGLPRSGSDVPRAAA